LEVSTKAITEKENEEEKRECFLRREEITYILVVLTTVGNWKQLAAKSSVFWRVRREWPMFL